MTAEFDGLLADAENDISRAVVVYLARGVAASPRALPDAVIAEFGPEKGPALAAQVEALIKEAGQITVDWSTTSLGDGGRIVQSVMGERHPALSAKALDALSWNWTFEWR